MSDLSKVGNLQISQDLGFQSKAWRFQRASWVILGLLLLAAAAGLFGTGLLSKAQAQSQHGGVEVKYERFARRQAAATLQLTVEPSNERQAVVEMNRTFIDNVRIEKITPEPTSTRSTKNGIAYFFPIDSEVAAITVEIDYQPESAGILAGEASLGGGKESVNFSQFIYP